jgi:hypothetical protein
MFWDATNKKLIVLSQQNPSLATLLLTMRRVGRGLLLLRVRGSRWCRARRSHRHRPGQPLGLLLHAVPPQTLQPLCQTRNVVLTQWTIVCAGCKGGAASRST